MFDPLSQPIRGLHSIEASAGTGKTYSITLLWLRLLIEEELGVEQVLVSTFTRAATAELKERLLAGLRNATAAAEAAMRQTPLPAGPESHIVSAFLRASSETAAQLAKRLGAALSSFDLAPISTIHGFCQTLMSRHALELGCDPDLALVENAHTLLEEIVTDTVLHFSDSDVPDIDSLPKTLRKISKPFCQWQGAEILCHPESPEQNLVQRIQNELPARKILSGIRTFDDILQIVRAALEEQGVDGPLASGVRKRLLAAIIDECQDSDNTQIRVFQILFTHKQTRSFLVIGDPKQSIYRFRGADLTSYKTLASKAIPAPQMKVNHRSDSPLIEALNFLYTPDYTFPDSLSKGDPTQYIPVSANHQGSRISDRDLDAALVFHQTARTDRIPAKYAIADWIAAECARLLHSRVTVVDRHSKQERTIEPGDMAVLAATKNDLRIVRRAIAARGIPCQMDGKGLGSVYSSDEAFDLLAWLELLASFGESGDTLAKLLTVLASPLGNLSSAEICDLRDQPVKIAELCEHFRAAAAHLARSGPLPALMQHLALESVTARNSTHSGGERRTTNWRHLASILQSRFANGLRTPAALAEWLTLEMGTDTHEADQEEGESTLMKLETDDSAVQMMTVHGSKGLEYPVVFCPYLWHVKSVQSSIQDMKVAILRESDHWVLDARGEDAKPNKHRALEQEKEEEFRKLYVALTRARHRLYIGLANIPAGGKQHANGSDQSCLMALPNLKTVLADAPAVQAQAPSGKPSIVFLPNDAPVRPSTAESAIAPGPHSPVDLLLEPAPICSPSALHPIFTKRSFSSLSRTSQSSDHHLHAPDRDAESGNAAPATKTTTDLLSDLGPAGSELGDQLHRALENFLGNDLTLRESVASFKNPEAWEKTLESIVQAPVVLAEACLRLESIRGHCITEMQFHMPTAGFSAMELSKALLADEAIASHTASRAWAEQVGQWSFSAFSGFLQGFIDLIFEWEGRWYVLDYKSNLLKGYDVPHLEAAMLHHHYLLQSRIYAVALHRHLQHHLPDFDPALHFGGVAYLFVRALPEKGTWFHRPQGSAMEALNALFPLTRP